MKLVSSKLAKYFLLSALASLAGCDAADDGVGENQVVMGVDLGTTYSVAAVYQNGEVEVITDQYGDFAIPSVAHYDVEKGHFDIGKRAKLSGKENVFYDAKRLIGHEFTAKAFAADKKTWPFTLVPLNGKPAYKVDYPAGYKGKQKPILPIEVSAEVLRHMRKNVEMRTGKQVHSVVITVPAYFGTQQRQDTVKAGELAGLNVLRVVNEPTAAALAFGLDKVSADDELVLVYDLGGGTFDVSLLVIDRGTFEVKGSDGDSHLGGQDFDRLLIGHFLQKESTPQKKLEFAKLSNREKANLKNEAERVKMALSEQNQVEMVATLEGVEHRRMVMRTDFNKLIAKLVDKTVATVLAVLKDAKKKPADVKHVVLAGGSSRIPAVQDALKKVFKGKKLRTDVDPDKAIAQGAAINAAIIAGVQDEKLSGVWLMDVTPFHLGIETNKGLFAKIVEKNSKIPTKKSQTFTTVHSGQTNVQIVVLQGVSPMARRNRELGRFTLSDIATGHPEIEITIKVDANGIVTVHAFEKGNNQQHEVTFEDALSFSNQELEDLEERFRNSQEEDEREADIIRMQEAVRAGAKRMTESGQLDESTKQRVEDLLKESNLISEYTQEDLDKMKDIHARFLSIAQMHAGEFDGASQEGGAEEDEEEDLDEEL